MPEPIKVTYKHFPAGGKHDSEQHRYEGTGRYEGSGLSNDIKMLNFSSNPYREDLFHLSVSVQDECTRDEDTSTTIYKLLTHAGFKVEEPKGHHADGRFYGVGVDNVGPDALIKAASALSTGFRDEATRTDYYPVMEAATANQIVSSELKRLGMSASQAKLAEIRVDTMTAERQKLLGLESPASYVDATVTYPHSAVTRLSEEGYTASAQGKNITEMHTRIEVTKGSVDKLRTALKAAGIDIAGDSTTQENKSDERRPVWVDVVTGVRAVAPADVVANALGKAGLLPDFIAKEVTETAAKAHPKQAEINQLSAQAHREFVQRLVVKEATEPEAPLRTPPGAGTKSVQR